jgi:hypothetical protein
VFSEPSKSKIATLPLAFLLPNQPVRHSNNMAQRALRSCLVIAACSLHPSAAFAPSRPSSSQLRPAASRNGAAASSLSAGSFYDDPLTSSAAAKTNSNTATAQAAPLKKKDLRTLQRFLEVECWKSPSIRNLDRTLLGVSDACKQINRIVQRAQTDDLYGAAVDPVTGEFS